MVIRIAELNSGPGPSTIYNDAEVSQENVAYQGDLLFSWSGSLGVYRWYRDEALINQHIFKVVCEHSPQWFAHYHLADALLFFQGIAADKATTMGHIKRSHLAEWDVAIPPDTTLTAANELVAPLYDHILQNERQSITLADLRDALLPKLLSGEIRVRQADTIAEEALA